VSAVGTEPVADVSVPLPTSKGNEVSLSQPAEAAESTTAAAATGAAEGVVGEAKSSRPTRSPPAPMKSSC
jgi:hypothetical protein